MEKRPFSAWYQAMVRAEIDPASHSLEQVCTMWAGPMMIQRVFAYTRVFVRRAGDRWELAWPIKGYMASLSGEEAREHLETDRVNGAPVEAPGYAQETCNRMADVVYDEIERASRGKEKQV